MYFGGLTLIVINLGLFGAIAQIIGFILIFRTFLPDLYDYICKIPFIGHYLSNNAVMKRATGCKTFWMVWLETIESDNLKDIAYTIREGYQSKMIKPADIRV